MHYLVRFAQLFNKNQIDIPQPDASDAGIATIFQVVLTIAGAIALIVVVVAGFKYTISQGDPAQTAKARNAIIYALVGLAICAFAFSIVTFVVKEAG